MSFSVFKANMFSYMNNQPSISSYEDWAAKFTTEYDLCIKRGKQTTNNIPISQPKKSDMESAVINVCKKHLSYQEGPRNFVDDLGNASIKYWTGAKLVVGIPPPIPALGAIVNVTSTAAYVTNPGTWSPTGPDNPTENIMDFLDKFIGGAKQHITTVQGQYDTISNYPGFPLVPPSPGIRPWKGWTVPG